MKFNVASKYCLIIVLAIAVFYAILPSTYAATCGDFILEGSEQCEDGNNDPTDGCHQCFYVCADTEFCGDGITNTTRGEVCDDGNRDNTDSCTNNCELPICGDGFRQISNGEGCDDGNLIPNDRCDTFNANGFGLCTPTYCGDGQIQYPNGDDELEICELGDTRSCPAANGYAGVENCALDCQSYFGCTATEFCGDGTRNGPEVCDDGQNDNNADGCTNYCESFTCDGDLNGDDTVDNADLLLLQAQITTTCTSDDLDCLRADINLDRVADAADEAILLANLGKTCSLINNPPVCGDFSVTPPETCDDGQNGDDSDGCTDYCTGFTCQTDLDLDNQVTMADLAIVQAETYRVCTSVDLACLRADVNRDGQVNVDDENLVMTNMGKTCTQVNNPTYCGDNITQPLNDDGEVEVCDGNNATCYTPDGYFGNKTCLADCSDFGACQSPYFCGDGIINGLETCDNGSLNGVYGMGCDTMCQRTTPSRCGDSIVQAPNSFGQMETCDFGDRNGQAGIPCNASCQFDSTLPEVCIGADVVIDTRLDVYSIGSPESNFPSYDNETFDIGTLGMFEIFALTDRSTNCDEVNENYTMTINGVVSEPILDDVGCAGSQRLDNLGVYDLTTTSTVFAEMNHLYTYQVGDTHRNSLHTDKMCFYRTNKTIEPSASQLQCYFNGDWRPCSQATFNTDIFGMRGQCLDPSNVVQDAVFTLRNLHDVGDVRNNFGWYVPGVSYTQIDGPWYVLNFSNTPRVLSTLTLEDSGAFEAKLDCIGNTTFCPIAIPLSQYDWISPFGEYFQDLDADFNPEYYCKSPGVPDPIRINTSATPKFNNNLECYTTTSSCAPAVGIGSLFSEGNSHMAEYNAAGYDVNVCCRGDIDAYMYDGICAEEGVVSTQGTTNAHAEPYDVLGAFDQNICISSRDPATQVTCSVRTGACNPDESCLVGVSGSGNAHVSSCTGPDAYVDKVCCKIQ